MWASRTESTSKVSGVSVWSEGDLKGLYLVPVLQWPLQASLWNYQEHPLIAQHKIPLPDIQYVHTAHIIWNVYILCVYVFIHESNSTVKS